MLGAIIGDIAGSSYEFHPLKGDWRDFPLFPEKSRPTDDTFMTLAIAEGLRKDASGSDLQNALIVAMHLYGEKYPKGGYGGRFRVWLREKSREPYNSFGNGSAMRASAAGWAARSLEEAKELATATAMPTHNHPEGVNGARAVAEAIYLARNGASREEIKKYLQDNFGYDLERSCSDIKKNYHFDETCQGSVPEAIVAFLESENFEEAIRKAIWLCGDADTQAAIAGSIAEAFYGLPEDLAREALSRLDGNLLQSYLQSRAWLEERGAVFSPLPAGAVSK